MAYFRLDNNRGRENGVRVMWFVVSDIIIYYCETVAGLEVFQLFDMPRGAYITPAAGWVEYGVGAVLRSSRADNCARLPQDLCLKYVPSSLVRNLSNALYKSPGPNRQ